MSPEYNQYLTALQEECDNCCIDIATESGDSLDTELSGPIELDISCTEFDLPGINEGLFGDLILEPEYIYINQDVGWENYSYVVSDLDLFWGVGAGVLKWYRVQGKCVPCSYNNNCESGLEVVGSTCTGGTIGKQFHIQNILATSIEEVCQILHDSKLNWQVCSIKVYSRPADPALSGPDDNCNILIDIPFENVPECLNVHIQDKSIIKMKMAAYAIEANFDVIEEDITFCEMTTESNLNVDTESLLDILTDGVCIGAHGEILTGGSALVDGDNYGTPTFEYISEGEPALILGKGEGSEPEYNSSWQNDLEVQLKMGVTIPYLEAVLNSQNITPIISKNDTKIRTLCGGCTSMPSTLHIFHNFANTPDIKNFLNKNIATLPDNFLMRYSKKTKMWMSNYQMLGDGNYGVEKWSFSFNWNCLNQIAEEYNTPFWRFSAHVNKYFFDSGLDFDTKIHIIFPPDYLCEKIDNFNFDLNFSLNTISEYVKNDFVSITEEVVLLDNIGLFKSDLWKSNPLLEIRLSNNTATPLLENLDLTPIIPVA